jgi:hypothetical protein
MQQSYNLTLVTGATEVLISPSARLIAIIPQGATTGTVTVREATAIGSGNPARWTAPSAGTNFGGGDAGVKFAGGLTVQLSVGADTFGIVWGPAL